jgi:putative transposase
MLPTNEINLMNPLDQVNQINQSNQLLDNPIVKDILSKIQTGDKIAPNQILQTAMNLLMLAERSIYLNHSNSVNSTDSADQTNPVIGTQNNSHRNKANGFFERELGTSLGSISLNVPRDRLGHFRPSSLPTPYQRDAEERERLIQSLLINGYSPNSIRHSLNSLGLHYNPQEIEELKNDYLILQKQWQSRQLPQDPMALFIDAYHCEALLQDKVHQVVLYVIVGVDFNGQKDLFGLYLFEGHENKGFWLQTLNQLIERGVKRPLVIISDDFSGLKESIATLFPQALHQLCFIHMQRNVRRNMGIEDSKTFNQMLKQIRLMDQAETCQKEFIQLCQTYQQRYPSFIKSLLDNSYQYFSFKFFPPDVQKHFYTTNAVESVNSTLEKLRIRMGGFFQSTSALYLNVFLTMNSIKQRKWQKGVPVIKGNLYSIRQLFAQRYGDLPKT